MSSRTVTGCPHPFCVVVRLDREWIGFVHPTKVSSHFWQTATTYWLTSPAKKEGQQKAKGVTENGNQAWGQIPKPVRMWLRPTHFCKAALQVFLPPVFNQSTSSSSQLRQQTPLLQPHHSGPPSSCCSALLRHTTASWKHTGSGTEAVQKSSKAQGISKLLEDDTSSPTQLPSSLFFQAQGAFSQEQGLWLDYRRQSTAKRKQSRSVTYAHCIKPSIWRTLLSLTVHR